MRSWIEQWIDCGDGGGGGAASLFNYQLWSMLNWCSLQCTRAPRTPMRYKLKYLKGSWTWQRHSNVSFSPFHPYCTLKICQQIAHSDLQWSGRLEQCKINCSVEQVTAKKSLASVAPMWEHAFICPYCHIFYFIVQLLVSVERHNYSQIMPFVKLWKIVLNIVPTSRWVLTTLVCVATTDHRANLAYVHSVVKKRVLCLSVGRLFWHHVITTL